MSFLQEYHIVPPGPGATAACLRDDGDGSPRDYHDARPSVSPDCGARSGDVGARAAPSPGTPGEPSLACHAQPRGAPSPPHDPTHAAVAPGESAAAAPPRPRRPALERSLIGRVAGCARGAYGRRTAPGAGHLPPGISSGLAGQVLRDADGPDALDGGSEPARGPGSAATRRTDRPAGATPAGHGGGQSVLSRGTRPNGRRTGGCGRSPHYP